jgi:hypothetical protein
MNIKNNPPRRTSLIWVGILIAGILIIFFPTIIGLDGFAGGYAISSGGLFITIMGLVGTVIYLRLAKILDRITRPENILAHWTYTSEEWKRYAVQEHREESAGKWHLFLLVAAIAVIVGIILYAIIREDLVIIMLIILGIIAITGMAAYFSTLANYLHNKKHLGETFIALDGVFLNRQTHIWKGLGNRLEEIVYDDDTDNKPRIVIVYSASETYNRNTYTIRILVPSGQESLAQNIVKRIASAHLRN